MRITCSSAYLYTSVYALLVHSLRFEKDFTVKEVLGHGGFGVVFHVKSSFDHSDYALKLTRLPDE